MDENPIKVEYDRESDILYIRFKEAEIVDTKMLSEDAYMDLDKDGNLVGIWRVSQNAILPISKDIAEKLKPNSRKPSLKLINRVIYFNLEQVLDVGI